MTLVWKPIAVEAETVLAGCHEAGITLHIVRPGAIGFTVKGEAGLHWWHHWRPWVVENAEAIYAALAESDELMAILRMGGR